jgi:hypothetical protein
MKNELDAGNTSPSNKVLVKCPDAALTEEIKDGILLDIRDDREILEIVLERLWIARRIRIAELSKQTQLVQLVDSLLQLANLQISKRIRSPDQPKNLLDSHPALLHQHADNLVSQNIQRFLVNDRPL